MYILPDLNLNYRHVLNQLAWRLISWEAHGARPLWHVKLVLRFFGHLATSVKTHQVLSETPGQRERYSVSAYQLASCCIFIWVYKGGAGETAIPVGWTFWLGFQLVKFACQIHCQQLEYTYRDSTVQGIALLDFWTIIGYMLAWKSSFLPASMVYSATLWSTGTSEADNW